MEFNIMKPDIFYTKQEIQERIVKLDKTTVRKGILDFEEKLNNATGSVTGEEADELCPLKHTFVDGAYIREIFMPKGTLLTSKIHKICHPYFVMKGDCSVLTDEGVIRIKAPFHGITQPGTKRILYMHEDTIWITVHITKHKELAKIEEEIIAKTFDEVLITNEEILKLKESINKEE